MASAQWFAVWTHSHCEQLVHDQLTAKGLRAVDKASHLEILKTKGVVRILGERWDRLTPVADVEIEALQRVVNSDLMVLPHSYLREGQRVRIEAGRSRESKASSSAASRTADSWSCRSIGSTCMPTGEEGTARHGGHRSVGVPASGPLS